jgi:ferrous iron transport protein B
MRISNLESGQRFKVRGILLAKEVGKRLADMGFTEGREGTVVRRGLMGGPMEVRILGYELIIRRFEAAGVEVDALPESISQSTAVAVAPEAPRARPTARPPVRVALAGNPNSGKTTLFNAITGAHHKVGNYPGVTVEKREGMHSFEGRDYLISDLPGIYSLTAYSIDEVVARDFVLDERPDVVVDVMDSTNLERHLYLCLQFQELGIPVVGALNMTDEAEAGGFHIDDAALSTVLGIPLVRTVGTRGKGTASLLKAIAATMERVETNNSGALKAPIARRIEYGPEIEGWLSRIEALIATDPVFVSRYPARWLAAKLLEKDTNAAERLSAHMSREKVLALASEAIAWIEKHFGRDAEIVVSEQRYGYIRGAVAETVRTDSRSSRKGTEAVDKVLMHPWFGLPIFLGILWGIFQLTFKLGAYPQALLEAFFGWFSGVATAVIPEGLFRLLIVNGVIGGVGSVFSFVPLIVILFFCLAILEDLGYMSRAAFLTDKLLHSFGLHGQSFLPMMLGFGCSVPAVMGARTLKSKRDRIATILTIPFMSCSAKLPVYVLLAAAFFPKNPGTMVMLVYGIGVSLALLSAILFKRTVLKGDPTPFVMELPPYRIPTLRGVLWHVWEKTQQYVKKMGTIILAMAVLVWVITTFPLLPADSARSSSLKASYLTTNPAATQAQVSSHVANAEAEEALAYSAAGRVGKFIEPVIAPLGFNWKLGMATVTGFAAKEVVVSTLGILYPSSTGETEGNAGLRRSLASSSEFSPLVAFVLMLTTLIFPPCVAALATIKAELGWRWLGFLFLYLLVLGWLLGAAVFQMGGLLKTLGLA